MLLLALQTPPATSSPAPAPQPGPQAAPAEPVIIVSYVPERVFDSRRKEFADFETMLANVASADVVFVGEQHDDRNTHRLELALLEGLLRRRGQRPIIVSLEMFERDVQQALNDYLEDRISEEEFLKVSRPWPRYATDYKPIVEFAKAHRWPVIASNVPRRLAGLVAKEGLAALEKLPAEERARVAQSIECPSDDYRKRFVASMNEHPAPGSEKMTAAERQARDERYYVAQCIKDETMAEAIVAALGPGRPLVVHYTGSFHSDFGHGTAARVKRRMKDARRVVISMLPVEDLDRLEVEKSERKRADYLVYTLKPRPAPHATR